MRKMEQIIVFTGITNHRHPGRCSTLWRYIRHWLCRGCVAIAEEDVTMHISQPQMLEPTIEDMIVCVSREVRMRHAVYPKRIGKRGGMSKERAEKEILAMEAVLRFLEREQGRQFRAKQMKGQSDETPPNI